MHINSPSFIYLFNFVLDPLRLIDKSVRVDQAKMYSLIKMLKCALCKTRALWDRTFGR